MWKIDQILALFAPFECLNCGHEGSLLCHECGLEAIPLPYERCYRCQSQTAGALCSTCQPLTPLTEVNVATIYADLPVKLIARLKFARTQAAAPLIAKLMDARLPETPVGTVVVHVPTAKQRVRQRGYDQAQLIAREFARRRRLPCQSLLRRRGHARQLGANRQQRQLQLQNAYYCPFPQRVQGRQILLIDDVLTTGATIEAAAKVVKNSGAREVSAALFAQRL